MTERFLDTVSPIDYRILVESLQPEMVKAKRLTTGKQITAVSLRIHHHVRYFSNTRNHRLKRKCIDSLPIMRWLMMINLSLDRQMRELPHYKQHLQQYDRLMHKGCYSSVNRMHRPPTVMNRWCISFTILNFQTLLGRYPTRILCAGARSLHLIHCPLLHRIFLATQPSTNKSSHNRHRNDCAFCKCGLLFKIQQHVLVIHEFISGTGELAYQQNQGLHHLRLHSWCFLHRESGAHFTKIDTDDMTNR
jgi:hypothetical protein